MIGIGEAKKKRKKEKVQVTWRSIKGSKSNPKIKPPFTLGGMKLSCVRSGVLEMGIIF